MKVLAPALPLLGVTLAAHEPPAPAIRRERPPPAPDEAALCTAALAGSTEAWSALVARHNHRVVV